MSLVVVESADGVVTITLNNPEHRNALDWPLLNEFAAAVEQVAADNSARALVVSGSGSAFCAGANLQDLFGDVDRPIDQLRDHLMNVYNSFLGLRDLKIPTIAAVQGPAVGAGLNIALACDVIVAGPRATFAPTFAEIGLHPGGGCTWMLTQRIGASKALAALLDGDPIDADTAHSWGIADALSGDPLGEATTKAQRWAARDSTLTADIKNSVQVAASSDLSTSVDFESWAQAASLKSDRFRAFMQEFFSD